MLQFTDSTNYRHSIDTDKVSNVVIRPQNSDFVAAFHFGGTHVVAATVDKTTAKFIQTKLADLKEPQQ